MTTLRIKATVTSLAAFSLAGTLAGCATATASGDSTNSASSDSSSSSSASTAAYKDGTYSASADYQSPEGTEDISVSLTIASGVVTAVKTTTDGTSPDEVHYQGEFNNNISSVVVGKKLDQLSVDKVAGSSLTSSGFNAAVTKIKTKAQA